MQTPKIGVIGMFPRNLMILNVHVHYEHTFLALLLSEIITFVTFKIQTINATWTLKMSVRGEEEIVTKSCKRHAEKRFIFIHSSKISHGDEKLNAREEKTVHYYFLHAMD